MIGVGLELALTPTGASGTAGRSYAEWVAEATRLSTSGAMPWAQGMTAGKWRTTMAASGGGLNGSSWAWPFMPSNTTSRVVQHAFPSSSAYLAAQATGDLVYIEVTAGSANYDLASVNRNGYASGSYANDPPDSFYSVLNCVDFIRFDRATGKAWRSNPRQAGAETEYTWP